MSKARDLANFGDDISDGVISAALDGDGSALTGISAGATEVVSSGIISSTVSSITFTGLDLTTYDYKLVCRNFLSIFSFTIPYLEFYNAAGIFSISYNSDQTVTNDYTPNLLFNTSSNSAPILQAPVSAYAAPATFSIDLTGFDQSLPGNGGVGVVGKPFAATVIANAGHVTAEYTQRNITYITNAYANTVDEALPTSFTLTFYQLTYGQYTLYRTVKS